MVAHPRAPLGPRDRRPLNAPSPILVQVDRRSDQPVAVRRRGWGQPRSVESVQDRWRIDDEWWRERPISRLYYTLLMDGGTLLTLYHDLVSDEWFEQKA